MKTCALPNGRQIACVSKRDALLIYDDLFKSDCYRRGGVTIKRGDIVVNVGANIGIFEVFLDSSCPGVRVVAIEPVPELCDVLRRNVKACPRIDVEVIEAAVTGGLRSGDMCYYPRLPSASTLHPDDPDETRERDHAYVRQQLPRWLAAIVPGFVVEAIRRWHLSPRRVPCDTATLRSVFEQKRLGIVNLLKIDAEGAEWGIIDSLGRDDWARVRQVIVEVHDAKSVEHMAAVLESVGFRVITLPNPAIPQLSICYGVKRE